MSPGGTPRVPLCHFFEDEGRLDLLTLERGPEDLIFPTAYEIADTVGVALQLQSSRLRSFLEDKANEMQRAISRDFCYAVSVEVFGCCAQLMIFMALY